MSEEQRIEALADALSGVLEHYRSADDIEHHAARAALEAMGPKDLVWGGEAIEKFEASTTIGEYYVEFDPEYGWGFWPPKDYFDDPSGGYHPTIGHAKGAANAHNRAAFWAMSKLGGLTPYKQPHEHDDQQ